MIQTLEQMMSASSQLLQESIAATFVSGSRIRQVIHPIFFQIPSFRTF